MPVLISVPMTARMVMPVDDATRRQFLGLLAAAGLLTACGDDAGPAAGSGGDGYYPRTVRTPDDGEVVIDRAPRRIGALNGNRVIPFLLPFLSANTKLVGFGGEATAEDYPWIAEQLDSAPASPDIEGPNLEAYAEWRADLLIANGNLGDFWEPARQVATLLQLPETDWRATVRLLGEVFDDRAAADRTIAETDALIDAARRTTPLTATVLSPYADDGTIGTQVPGAELPNFLADLGITVAPDPEAEDGYGALSLELIETVLDVDFVIVLNNGDELQRALLNDPLFARSAVARAGRVVVLDPQQSAAGFPVTPPTVPIVLDAIRPLLDY